MIRQRGGDPRVQNDDESPIRGGQYEQLLRWYVLEQLICCSHSADLPNVVGPKASERHGYSRFDKGTKFGFSKPSAQLTLLCQRTMLSLAVTQIVSGSIHAILYGLYLATLVQCLRWLLFDDDGWKFRAHINWFMLTVTLFIFLFSTADFAGTIRLFTGDRSLKEVGGVSAMNVGTQTRFFDGGRTLNSAGTGHTRIGYSRDDRCCPGTFGELNWVAGSLTWT